MGLPRCQWWILLIGLSSVAGHGRLMVPSRRGLRAGVVLPSGHDYLSDEDAPLNFKGDDWPESRRFPVMDPSTHPDGSSWVCRVNNQNHAGGVDPGAVTSLHAGGIMPLMYELTADHPGNADVWLSYDWDLADMQQMRWFKIAQLPQTRCNNRETLRIKLPAWLPAGRAVVRWAWYALHTMDEAVEFFAQCADVLISSSSSVPIAAIPTYTIEVDGAGGGRPTGAYPGAYSWPFRDTGSQYWQYFEESAPFPTWKHLGPPCVGGVQGNCCNLSHYTPHIVGGSAECNDASGSFGFHVCADSGSSGPALFLNSSAPLPSHLPPPAPPSPPLPPPTMPLPPSSPNTAQCTTAAPNASASIDWKLGMSACEQSVALVVGGEATFSWRGFHNVVQVPTRADYDACEDADGTQVAQRSLGGAWTLQSGPGTLYPAGTYYFICVVQEGSVRHCHYSQKVAVTIHPSAAHEGGNAGMTSLPFIIGGGGVGVVVAFALCAVLIRRYCKAPEPEQRPRRSSHKLNEWAGRTERL